MSVTSSSTLRNKIPEPIRCAVDGFRSHLADHVPSFEIVLLVANEGTNKQWEEYRRQTGYHQHKGVYLHCSDTNAVLYVGSTIQKRSQNNEPLDRCWGSRKEKRAWDADRRWTYAVLFQDEWAFFVRALEVYLVAYFQPKHNVQAKDLPLPDPV